MSFTDEWLVPTVSSLVSEQQLALLRRDAGNAGSLWEALVERRFLADDQIVQAVAARFRMPVADLAMLDHHVQDTVPEQVARKYHILPLRTTDSYLEIATANPFDIDAEKMLAFATGREVRLLLLSPGKIRDKLDELYRPEDVVSKLLSGISENEVTQLSDEADEYQASAEEAQARPIIKLVDTLIADGITCRASDIHVEPAEGGVVVRYRIDGVLRQVMKIPRSAGLPLVSRIKIMSGMDIADRLRPQDGRCRVAVNGNPIDLRVSTLPASLGEKAVIRILNAKATILSLDALGFLEEERATVTKLLDNKEGILLVTGPTGSGKTTTLYAALRQVQGEGVNIVTVEDPVEYRLGSNIVQVQVHEKAGLTFATALRSILRQDPDVVLIGEIRDVETSQIAVQASLTGHLVLSTLHTNDAPNTVTRLVDMGMEAYKIASALRGIIAQRLLRRLCSHCRIRQSAALPERVRQHVPAGANLYQAVGCSECAQTGYRGRFAILEILVMTQELERLIGKGATADHIATAARSGGMRTLFDSGMRHVLLGETSIEELLRVTEPPREDDGKGGSAAPDEERRAPRRPVRVVEEDDGVPVRAAGTVPAGRMAAPTIELSPAFELLDDLPPARTEITRKGAMVLLVDDEDQLRRVMRDLLQRQGYTVVEARDGAQALDEVDRHNPDIVLLDLNLPGVDGYSVLSQLRSRPATRQLPVIVLTAKGDEDNEVRVLELGADDFLTKPFRAKALAARLESALSRRRV
ncbi:MAG TPA: type II/IV secretion system protein [Gemmatimonadales bacterium]|jgi:type II secretory ATPase GspE/PulE/Tfp pilus assembly ATPase PilB-like protein/CheY-like chemotaxis protein